MEGRVVPSEIKNKIKRSIVYREQKADKKKIKREERKKRQRETEEAGEDAVRLSRTSCLTICSPWRTARTAAQEGDPHY